MADRVIRALYPGYEAEELEGTVHGGAGSWNEGLMIKDLESSYTPGRRGKSWLKMKRELATLDVVVTAVEYGHGKRALACSAITARLRCAMASVW